MADDSSSLRDDHVTNRYQDIRRVTVIGGIVDLVLGIAKLVVGKLVHSQALVADGVHSLSDLATDVLVIWAAKHASRGPDEQHPYGHQRIETVATITLGIMLAVVAIGIAYSAVEDVIERHAMLVPGALALVVAALSVIAKEWIYQYTVRAARRLQSEMLRSNAWHSRTDALSSVVVIVGVAGSMLGWTYLDAIAAVVVAVMILYVAGGMIWNGTRELIDTGVEPKRVAAMKQTIANVEGVVDAHEVRTRLMGSDIYLDGHVRVDPKVSVSEGHRIGEAVRQRLTEEFEGIADITIHVDSEDDEAYQRSDKLPLRGQLEEHLLNKLRHIPEAQRVDNLIFHYLNGRIQAEIWLPLSQFESIEHAEQTAARIREQLIEDETVQRIDVLFN